MEQSEAKRLFKKLKIRTLLDLALILPVKYNDSRISQKLQPGEIQTLAVVVESIRYINGQLRVNFRLRDSFVYIEGLFFKTTPYHKKLFTQNSEHIIQGKVGYFGRRWQISQPKSLKDYGKIIPKYKTPLKESEIKALISAYVNRDNLQKEGLSKKECDTLLEFHYPKLKIPSFESSKRVLKFIEAYNHLKKLRGKRREYPALYALRGDITEFIESLPFRLTNDQLKAIDDIKRDLANIEKSARRIIIGDVGSGKTMVILSGAVIAGEKKSVLMAPTSLLAKQLYDEALKFLPKRIRVALVMQGGMEGDYKDADFIIGTHALLYLDNLPSAGLVMVDEQHRFGTKQRAVLEAMLSQDEKRPHYIQFSATPIPRTQAMMNSALIDVTLIEETPFVKKIHSKVIGKNDFASLLRHIESEISKEHQVLIVYPLVEESEQIPYQSIDEARGFWEKRYDSVYVTHGRDKNKDEVLLEFRERGKILLATTVIEVGISLPKLTTIVIVGGERLGLATLHQLRGRVGRNGLESWCFIYTRDTQNKRLESFCKTTNGFDIARLDLEYRNSGDILDGTIQSGQKFRWLNLAEDEEIIKEAQKRLKI